MMAMVLAFSVVPHGVGDPVRFFVLAAMAVMFMGAAKAGFAGGAGLLSVPLMIYACGGDSRLAAGIMLPLLIACDYVAIFLWWRRWDLRNVWLLGPGMLLGVGLGWVALWWFFRLGGAAEGMKRPNAALALAIGLLAVGFVGLQAVRVLRGRVAAFRPVLWQGTIVGATAGLTSTLAHAAGPIITMFIAPQKMPKGKFVATTVLYYWIGNQIKLVPYLALGMLSTPSLAADVALLPAVVGGALLGVFLHHRVNEKAFSVLIHAILAAVGLHLAIVSARALWFPPAG